MTVNIQPRSRIAAKNYLVDIYFYILSADWGQCDHPKAETENARDAGGEGGQSRRNTGESVSACILSQEASGEALSTETKS